MTKIFVQATKRNNELFGESCTVENSTPTSTERPNPDGKMLWSIIFRDGTELVAFEDEICL